MQDLVTRYLNKFRKERRMRRRLVTVLVVLACIVSLGVYWQLKLTGAALTNETFCGKEEHVHDSEDCYEWVLVCGYDDVTETTVTAEELEALWEAGGSETAASLTATALSADVTGSAAETSGHTHTAECYRTVTKLVCGQPESEGHTHSESCYSTVLTCGLEESEGHTHSDSCYDEKGNLICGLDESEGHTHDESCYTTELTCGLTEGEGHTHDASCYETEEILICGLDEAETAADGESDAAVISDTEHVHTAACYEKVLVCELEEHTHSAACLSDNTADVETAEDWEATLPADLSEDWAEAVVEIALSQLGYTESTANFTLDEDGETLRGYTRYGAWAGNEYGDWDAMFASFCLSYAGLSTEDFPQATGAYAWAVKLQNLDLYADAADYTPVAGDLVFTDSDADGKIDRVGIVISVDAENDSLTVIEGDYATEDGADAVCEVVYGLSNQEVVGYGVLPEYESNFEIYTATADGVTVTVTAPIGALPEGAQLSVALMEEGSEAYHAAAEAIGYGEETVEAAVSESEDGIALASEEDAETETVVTSGLAVLDISFTLDGEEIEPTEAVTVSIDASAIIPEEADASTIEVQHLTETEDGVVEPTLVADATAETDGTVTVLVEDETTTAVVEFEVESFSSFTITWQYGNNDGDSISINVNIYDTNGNLIDSGVETVNTKSFTATDGLSISTLTGSWTVDGYAYAYATVGYTSSSYGQSLSGTVGSSSDSVTTISRSTNTGSSGQDQGNSYTITTTSGGTQSASSISAINLYYEADGPTVTVTATMTDSGYLLTATPVDFTSTENITYTWSISVSETVATITNNDDGTATLTWTDGWQESTSNETDTQALNNLVTVSVTGTSTYTDENGETMTETGDGSVNISSYYVKVYVYVAAYDDSGNLFSDEMLALLGIDENTLDGNGYFPAGEIKLDVAFLYGKNYTTQGAPLLTSAGDWTDLLAALSEMETSTLIEMSGVDYSLNQGNSVGNYLEMARQDVNKTWGSQCSALFRWNTSTSYGFSDQTVRYHLDLRFSTNTITFKYGNNELVSDGDTVEYRVYITGSTIQEMQESLTIPSGYKFAGFYEDADFTTPWDGVGTPITEDVTVYIKLVPISYVVITYQVAIGEGTVTSPDANNTAVQKGYETFDPDDDTYTVEGSTATADDGWEFAGWYLDAECTNPVNSSWVDDGHITPNEEWSSDGTYIYYAKFVQAIYNITLKKVDSKSGDILSDASFTLSRTDGETTSYYTYNATDDVVNWVEDAADATAITTGTGGTEVIHSLTTGYTYTLTETAAPDGYNLLTDSITFTVSGGRVADVTCATSDVASVSENGKTITVANTPGYELPSAGGPGTALITLLGLLLCGGAGLLLCRRRPG